MSVQKFDHKSLKVLVCGVSGMGKTTMFLKLLRAEKARVKFVFDHQGEFSVRFDLPAVVDFEGLYKAAALGGWCVFDPIKLCEWEDQDGHRIGMPGAFALFCEVVFEICKMTNGRKIIVCDELHRLTDTRVEPREFISILDTGRRQQTDVFAIAQAPNQLHNGIRNQLTKVFTFRQSDDNAINYFKANGFDEKQIRELPPGKFLWRDLNSGEAGAGGKAF